MNATQQFNEREIKNRTQAVAAVERMIADALDRHWEELQRLKRILRAIDEMSQGEVFPEETLSRR